MLILAVAQEVERVIHWSQGWWFNPSCPVLLSACQSVFGQNTEPQIAPCMAAHGHRCVSVCDWLNEQQKPCEALWIKALYNVAIQHFTIYMKSLIYWKNSRTNHITQYDVSIGNFPLIDLNPYHHPLAYFVIKFAWYKKHYFMHEL